MDDVVLTLTSGRVRVRRNGDLIQALGLRYATARRFAPPEPLPSGDEVTDATHRGPMCPQLPSRLEFVVGALTATLATDEDCLTLAITAPVPDGNARPVMVFLHGGAYVTGSGQTPAYDLSAMAGEGDVVAVTVNYRLGLFGFLAIDGVSPANLGLLDQIAALRWVHENISGFGGDPNQVTVFGQSAGADSISYLMIADGAEDLFQRAILQSGPLGIQRNRGAMSRAMGTLARKELGAQADTLSSDEVLAAQTTVAAAAREFGTAAQMPFGPQTGHHPLPADDDVDARRRAVATRIPVMIGSTADDALPFLMLNPRTASLLTQPVIGKALSTLVTRRMFRTPAMAFAKRHRRGGGHALTYNFDWRPAGSPFGACHCVELPFLMGSPEEWEGSPMLGSRPLDALAEYGPAMRQLWYEFAHGMFDHTDAHVALPGTLRTVEQA